MRTRERLSIAGQADRLDGHSEALTISTTTPPTLFQVTYARGRRCLPTYLVWE